LRRGEDLGQEVALAKTIERKLAGQKPVPLRIGDCRNQDSRLSLTDIPEQYHVVVQCGLDRVEAGVHFRFTYIEIERHMTDQGRVGLVRAVG